MPKLLPGGYILCVEKLVFSRDNDWAQFDFGRRYQLGVMLLELTLAVKRKVRGIVYVVDIGCLSVDWVTNYLAAIGKVRKFFNTLQVSREWSTLLDRAREKILRCYVFPPEYPL